MIAFNPFLQFLLSSTIIFSLSSSSATAADILPGQSLSAANPNQSWNSPSNTFSLSFISESRDTNFVAIIYNGISLWKAGGDAGVADSTASLTFLSDGNLRLVNGSSGSVVWQSNTAGRGVTTASLDDSGNLVLRNGSVSVWSTFENPSDTILPNQNFTVNNVLRSGLYSFRLIDSGNLTLRWNDSIVYWTLGLNSSVNANLTSPSLGLQSIGILSLSDPMLPTSVIMAYSSDYAEGPDIFRFTKLDNDGNLRIYSSSMGTVGAQNVRWAAVSDQCEVFGYCGNLGICSYNGSDPVCGCPSQNFDAIDPNDGRKGCRRKVEIQNCPGSATMLELDNSKFLTYPPELTSQVFFVGISACRLNCLVSGSCIASTSLSDGTGLCYLKVPSFVSGYQSPALPSTSYLKVCGPVTPNPSVTSEKGTRWKLRPWVVVVVVIGTLFGLVMAEFSLWWWCCRNSPKLGVLSAQYALLEYASGAPVQFSYKDLQRATKGFKEKLGAGGFGAVYKGVLANRTVVAVKQLEGIEQGEKQFRMEVATISSTHHLNLVRLIGFCSEGRHRLLVYEFMKNSSLDNFLFTAEEQSGKMLNWESRFNVALGTARGITYLHEECRDCIVHCDIKPENILLDENYNAKVSDFGLAKLVNPKDHRYRTLTSVRGTRGYLAPEWLANLPITSKSDVYSYGMVLLEIVCGRRNFEVSEYTNRKKFSSWAYEEFNKGNIKEIIDKKIVNHDQIDIDQVRRVIETSFWCIQEQPSQRPMMGKVVQMLEGVTEMERPPDPKTGSTIEGSVAGTSVNLSSSVSTSTPSSMPPPSSSSSLQTLRGSSFTSGMNIERASSSLLNSVTM
ncbi:G-type lectin S-receptor-like serine/threonine-protein kinase At1g34300 isoform X1 [Cynara cardunculus var. scolymus]|uniref:Receptor-like serine/threonine-protein kinase n=1 Tax=Cynara cardunculus var. scolymus TaxID=59895 RepID=A0A103XXH3_CYNCS|nr:G-type lectin S-receptor-like serine/threonine-protein kinase At1g34300 isoform X1 [Cynara cardunculus var. scolymus]KVH98640.1 Bulb-type lectin domain-containing protein [Cynara cardunculus var. scolymus]